MAEEDSGYRQLQILQDAGIIPVQPGQGQNNLGRSGARADSGISPEMMEKIMKEDAEIAQQQRENELAA